MSASPPKASCGALALETLAATATTRVTSYQEFIQALLLHFREHGKKADRFRHFWRD
jgi:hypothetical protein